jgi:hypothetical protein
MPASPWPSAAVQLHRTSRSSIVQHFRGAKVSYADKSDPAMELTFVLSGDRKPRFRKVSARAKLV